MMDSITFIILLFPVCYSLCVALSKCINYSVIELMTVDNGRVSDS